MTSVLYIDDEPEFLEIARLYLERTGNFTLDKAESAEAALEKMARISYDAIVSDYLMPGMNGIELLKEVRKKYPEIPFLIFTGKGREDVAVQALDEGADFYVQKGGDVRVQFRDLAHKIQQAVRRRKAEEDLWRSEERFRELFERMSSGVAVYEAVDGGSDFIFRDFNKAGERIERTSRSDLIGRRVTEVFPGVRKFGIFDIFERVYKTGVSEYFPETLYRDDRDPGSWRENWVYRLPSGEIVAVYNDITERKRTELALELANKKLNLLSSITRHDILNQISALKGYLALSHGYLGDERTLRDIIDRMDGAVATIEQQIRITKDYKDLGAVPAGWKNVNECITKAMTDLPMQDIQVENDCTNLEIFADPLVEKVFFNLMDNSVGFSSDRMTKIRISCRETVSGLILIYEDNGAGIAPEDKPYLFSRGFRQNTGLGLFLAREILSITGITIQETGERGKGARFEMMVPNGGYRFFRMNH